MTFALLALLVAAPPSCEQLWARVWKDLTEREFKGGNRGPLFDKVPDALQRLERAWVGECKRFKPEVLACAQGTRLEEEIGEWRRRLAKEKVPQKEIDEGMARLRAEWSPLDCPDVNRSIDRAAAAVARDAGLEN